jgi:hypothetical protein
MYPTNLLFFCTDHPAPIVVEEKVPNPTTRLQQREDNHARFHIWDVISQGAYNIRLYHEAPWQINRPWWNCGSETAITNTKNKNNVVV